MGDWAAGFAGGLAPGLGQIAQMIAQEHQQKTQQQGESNKGILEQLDYLSKSTDPEMQTRAISGMMQFREDLSAGKKPPKGGWKILSDVMDKAKWAENPHYQRLKQLAPVLKAAQDAPPPGTEGGGEGALPGGPPTAGPPPVPESLSPTGPAFGEAGAEGGFQYKGADPSIMSPGQPVGGGSPQPAAAVEGTGQIQPAAALGSVASTIKPTTDRPLSADMESLGFRPGPLGSYGEQGDKLLGSVYAGRVSDKEALRRRTDLARTAAGVSSRESEGEKNRLASMERTKTRTQAAWDRLQEQQSYKTAHPSARGTKSGINYEKEIVTAGKDYQRDLEQLNGQERDESTRIQLKAMEYDWDPAQVRSETGKISDYFRGQKEQLSRQFEENTKMLGVLAGGRSLPGAGAGAAGRGKTTPPPKVGDVGGKTYKWGGRRGLTWDQLPPAGQAAARAAGQAPQ